MVINLKQLATITELYGTESEINSKIQIEIDIKCVTLVEEVSLPLPKQQVIASEKPSLEEEKH